MISLSSNALQESSYINKKTTIFIFAGQAFMTIYSFVVSYLEAGWQSVAYLAYGMAAIFLIYLWQSKNIFFMKLMIFGITVGFVELFADHWAVQGGTLVYPPNEPFIWSSPAYMPISWMLVIVQLSYVGALILKKKNILWAMPGVAAIGGMYIPLYEHLAKGAGWWYYQNTPMFWDAPYYIIMVEMLLSLLIPVFIINMLKNKWYFSLAFGLIEGIWIYIAALLSFALVG